MRKLRIGVWINDDFIPESGGKYGYFTELVAALSNYPFKNAEVVFLSDKKIKSEYFETKIFSNSKSLKDVIKSSPFKKIIKKIIKSSPILERLVKKERKIQITNKLKNEIREYVDVIYYLTQDCIFPEIPYIYTLWDLGHSNSYAFPELSMDGIFEKRKHHNDLLPQKALMIFSESETGKKQCEKYLDINGDRIKVIPVFPSGVINQKCLAVKPKKMNEGDFFIHYPAQYWSHKNHYNLLMAMVSVIKIFPHIKLILTGSDKGNKAYILKTISEFNLEENVKDLGFVSLEELRWLYENSQGLVMATLLGPTNMPLLEAAELGCPVACTNLPGHIEQLEEYGYYFNGLDPEDIANKIILMIKDRRRGIVRKYNNRFNIKNALEAIDEAFTELRQIKFCWDKN